MTRIHIDFFIKGIRIFVRNKWGAGVYFLIAQNVFSWMLFSINYLLKAYYLTTLLKYMLRMIKYFLIGIFMYGFSAFSQTCQPNDPYDQIVTDFHSTVARRQDGTLVIWGEKKASNGIDDVLAPQVINSTNYPGLTGKPIRAALGSNNGGPPGFSQGVLLTTTGLFAWGDEGIVILNSLTTSSTFQKLTVGGKADGLPLGVSPTDVKIMTATYQSLAIVTKTGEVWLIGSSQGMYGDGTTAVTNTWHQVQSADSPNLVLKGIVQFRMSPLTCFAVDSNNVFYTWGVRILKHNPVTSVNIFASSNRAVILPGPSSMTSELPKMIASTSKNSTLVAYFILLQNGELYSIGSNTPVLTRTTNLTNWERVKKNATENFENVIYISAQDSDARFMSIAAITSDNNLWAWGDNDFSMLGGTAGAPFYSYPHTPDGFIMGQDKANYVEMGGHTLVYVKDGADRYCYVGHRINGSMGDGTDIDVVESSLNCTNTPAVPLCSLCPATFNNIIPPNRSVCESYSMNEFDSKIATLSNNNSVFYQWQSSSISKDAGFVNITGATTKNYMPAPLTATRWYRRIVTNTTPNCPIDSSNVMQVSVNSVPLTPLLLNNQELCAGDNIVLTASAAAGVSYTWKGPDQFTSSAIKPIIYNASAANAGEYTLSVTDDKNCSSDTASTSVLIHTIGLQFVTSDTVCEGRSLLLEVADPLASWTYLWTGPDGFISNKDKPLITQANADKMGTYMLEVRDDHNCKATESLTVSLGACEPQLTIPEGFSPNGDGVNDVFIIRGLSNYPNHSIVIFNRWGQKVFQAAPYNNDWRGVSQYGIVAVGTGELLPEGTYFYLMDKNNGEEPIKGSIYLKK